MAPPRKHPTDEILDAARTLVLREGPRAASVKAIAGASGAPVGTLYHRFGSRDGLLAQTWLRALGRFQELALAAAAEHEDPLERGVALAGASMALAREHPDDARLLLALRRDDLLDASPGEELAERLKEMNAPLLEEVRELARRLFGHADARSVDAILRAVVDLPYGALRRHEAATPPAWLEEDVTAAARTLLQATAQRSR
jgi:AcrR family transcriptional regulator